MIAGQLALIEAASAAGVRRFFPSDFGADGGVLSSAEHAALNVSLRRLIDGKEARFLKSLYPILQVIIAF